MVDNPRAEERQGFQRRTGQGVSRVFIEVTAVPPSWFGGRVA